MTDGFLKVADIAKVVGNRAGHGFDTNTKVVIAEVDEPDTYLTYLCKEFFSPHRSWWVSPTDIVPYNNTPGEDCIF